MQILVRNIRRSRKGAEEVVEDILGNPIISVGRAGDQVIQLLDPAVAPRHMVLQAGAGGRFSYRVVEATRLEVNGESRRGGTLAPGQVLELGAQRLEVIAPPSGFDAALEVILSEPDKAMAPATQYRTRLAQTSLGTRKWAWLLAVAIPLLFFVIPLAGFIHPHVGTKLRQDAPLLSDAQWNPGPLSNAHHIPGIGKNCNACHMKLFTRVPNKACAACHDDIHGHVDWQQVSVPRLANVRCASCHVEHNEPPNLVRNDPQVCIDCHVNLHAVATAKGGTKLPLPTTEFTKQGHPQFWLAMLRQTGTSNQWHVQEATWGSPSLAEQSNLKFPHNVHMNPAKVLAPETGKPLQCTYCHKLKNDGEHFKPITMEVTCRKCHTLSFDDATPNIQLPHGDVAAAVLELQEHYIRKFADPVLRQQNLDFLRRRPAFTQTNRQCQGTPFQCGEQVAEQTAVDMFTRIGCVTCHTVTTHPGQPLMQRWSVEPVRLQSDWYPTAAFNHKIHMTRSKQNHGQAQQCTTCHAAEKSKASTDILIPGIANCLQCHGPVGDKTRVAMTCESCHTFHQPAQSLMLTAKETALSEPGKAFAAR